MDAYQKAIAAMSNLPVALKQVYEEDPNKLVVLYKGLLELQQTFTIEQADGSNEIKEHIEAGCGHIEFSWFPLPCVKFEFFNHKPDFWLDVRKPIFLKLSDFNISVPIRFSECHQGGQAGNKVSGRIREAIAQGSGQDLSYVMFHVVNFSDFIGNPIRNNETHNGYRNARVNIELVEENWKLTLDKLQSISEHLNQLKTYGGFTITHVGKLEHLHGETFSGEEAKNLLEIFQNFLSFARGFRVPVVLLSGYDSHGMKIWEYWDLSQGDSWQGVNSLFPESDASGQFLADVFPGFFRWWQDENWKKSVNFILHCYLEANIGSGGAEGALILEQTVLELIAYIKVGEEFTKSDDAAKKISKLLSRLGIPKNVPPSNAQELPASEESLSAFAQAIAILAPMPSAPPILEKLQQVIEKKNSQATQDNQRWEDGPRALTKVRNDIAHARKDLDFLNEVETAEVRWETSELGLWYLDVVLLNLFGYKGNYINRLNGNTEPLPGANIDNFAENQYGTQQTTQLQPNPTQPPETPQ
jgi:hypothetical protein